MLRALLSVTPELAVVFGRDRRPVFINPAFSALWQGGPWQFDDVLEVVHPEDRHSFRKAVRAVTASRHHRATRAVLARVGPAACWRTMDGRLTNMLDEAAVAGIVFHARDVSGHWPREMPGAAVAQVPGLSELSSRELEVVTMLLAGDRVPAIAKSLFIAQSTVRNHLSWVFRKLQVRSQQELIVLLRPRQSEAPLRR